MGTLLMLRLLMPAAAQLAAALQPAQLTTQGRLNPPARCTHITFQLALHTSVISQQLESQRLHGKACVCIVSFQGLLRALHTRWPPGGQHQHTRRPAGTNATIVMVLCPSLSWKASTPMGLTCRTILQSGAAMPKWRVSSLANCSACSA